MATKMQLTEEERDAYLLYLTTEALLSSPNLRVNRATEAAIIKARDEMQDKALRFLTGRWPNDQLGY